MTEPVLRPGTEDFYARNLRAFEQFAPSVLPGLPDRAKTVSKLLFDDGKPVNIDLGDTKLYPTDAQRFCDEQLDMFARAPDRITFDSPSHCNLSHLSVPVIRQCGAFFTENKVNFAGSPQVDIGFAFVLGVGLGVHLPRFLQETDARHLVIVEPIAEFMHHALLAIDWEAFFTEVDARGMTVRFLFVSAPDLIAEELVKLVHNLGNTFLEGSHSFLGYFSWALREARTVLNEKIKNLYLSAGFFEDEVKMLRNTYLNSVNSGFRLVERKPFLPQALPVFIVGAGPSLTKDLPVLRRWRDHVLLVSSGTALGILLREGFTPDIHVENENVPVTAKIVGDLAAKFDLSGVTLLATTTVDPHTAALFKDKWYYLRASLSVAHMFRQDTTPIDGAEPVVSNAAYAALTAAGFREFYLFGVDCGKLEEADHHAEGSIYEDKEVFEDEMRKKLENQFDRVVPGNFGGKARTAWHLDLSRFFFTRTLRNRGGALFNCSDGARIDGAIPKHPRAVKFAPQFKGQAKSVLAKVANHLRVYEPGAFLAAIDFEDYAQRCDDFDAAIDAAFDLTSSEDKTFFEFDQRMERFWTDHHATCIGVMRMVQGSLGSLLRLGAFYWNRIDDSEKREQFRQFYIELYREACHDMAAISRDMFTAIAAGDKDLDRFVETPEPAKAKTA
ncbi:MAG: 6-hydroxymethylpterin diphosphokinase MptE-like protein [Magnetospiraceae bacterium]